ncbi:MAG TPA: type IX secretion system membrane protein PorP/SprF, partial [Nitrosopumilaceae archaeon]|nr:type IX secretion system membrane protein PorP/SprF [Nitrosopumilaceae archaeon]
LNRPNESLIGAEDAIIPIRYSIHGGMKFALNEDEKDDFSKKYLSTAFHYRKQNEFDQFDIGLYYTQYIFNLGLWYRGIPGLKAYKPGYRNDDAVSIIVGIKTDRFNIGYSYDITISQLAGLSHGAQEICLSYQLCKLSKKKKKRLVIPCPKF